MTNNFAAVSVVVKVIAHLTDKKRHQATSKENSVPHD
jgi:hypothetical protein